MHIRLRNVTEITAYEDGSVGLSFPSLDLTPEQLTIIGQLFPNTTHLIDEALNREALINQITNEPTHLLREARIIYEDNHPQNQPSAKRTSRSTTAD